MIADSVELLSFVSCRIRRNASVVLSKEEEDTEVTAIVDVVGEDERDKDRLLCNRLTKHSIHTAAAIIAKLLRRDISIVFVCFSSLWIYE